MLASTFALMVLSGPAWAGDKDKDGVSNKVDQCKTEPEDKDGFKDDDGCPDPDNDEDGLLDGDDTCADEAEDKDGFEDEDGCPDPDNDGDGVLDASDKCADESENDDNKDGCPTVSYDLLTTDGWAPAVKSLSGMLAGSMNAEGCNDASEGAQKWLADNDVKKLHAVFLARAKRDDGAKDVELVAGTLAPHATFWASAGEAYDLYCKDHVLWPKVRPQLDAVYKMVAPKE